MSMGIEGPGQKIAVGGWTLRKKKRNAHTYLHLFMGEHIKESPDAEVVWGQGVV